MFELGQKSLVNMVGIHPDLAKIVTKAIGISTQDFGVTEPQVRTLAYQRQLVERGVSKTLKSNHLEQTDLTGRTANVYGHAIDLVPYAGGKFVWDWKLIYPITVAMALAAEELQLRDKMCWGGVWDRWMNQYPCDTAPDAKKATDAYCGRHPGPDFVDGPHFQIYKRG